MATPLDNYPGIRSGLYNFYWLVGLLLGTAQVVYVALGTDAGIPHWLTAAFAAYGYLGIGIGYTAAANMPKTGDSK